MIKVLKAKNLVKRYGDFYAVNNADLNLKKGRLLDYWVQMEQEKQQLFT